MIENKTTNYTVDESAKRLDVYISSKTGFSRSKTEQMIAGGFILLNNGAVKKSGTKVKVGDVITVIESPPVEKIEKKDIPIEILFEDESIAVINKPKGLTVHPAGYNRTDTLVNALMFNLNSLSAINGELRPGIVHRLDKDTSGVMVVAKNDKAHISLSSQIKDRTVQKIYLSILEGVPKKETGSIDTLIGRDKKDRKKMTVTYNDGRQAITKYKVLQAFNKNSYVEFEILTGRTHQIRVHAKHMGNPVVGDPVYGYKKQRFSVKGQLLHAYKLSFNHPETNERLTFTAPLPDDFTGVLKILQKEERE